MKWRDIEVTFMKVTVDGTCMTSVDGSSTDIFQICSLLTEKNMTHLALYMLFVPFTSSLDLEREDEVKYDWMMDSDGKI